MVYAYLYSKCILFKPSQHAVYEVSQAIHVITVCFI